MKERLLYFDIAKGLGIILVIVGHNMIPHWFFNWIFSFHMPLFFIISGYFMKPISVKDSFMKGMRQLIYPLLFAKLVWFLLLCVMIFRKPSIMPPIDTFLFGVLFDSGNYKFGIGWFLICLFWGKLFMSYIRNHSFEIHILIASFLFVIPLFLLNFISYEQIETVPFFLHRFFTVPLFLCIGIFIKRYIVIDKLERIPILLLLIILLSMYRMPMNMGCLYFSNPVWNVISSTIATLIILFLCRRVEKWNNNIVIRVLAFYGKNSLLILCVHGVEWAVQLHRAIPDFIPDSYHFLVQVIAIGFIVYYIKRIKIIKCIYNIQ